MILRKIGSFDQASFKPFGGSGSLRNASSLPISRSSLTDSAPMPKATRSGVPNRLPSTGMSKPVGFSNSSAGPLARRVRSHLGHFQHRGHRNLDAFQLSALLQLLHEIPKILEFH
jgi:hypothetical protein